MDTLRNFFTWLFSAQAREAWFLAIVIFFSMLVSAWIAARIARRTAGRLIEQRDFELRASAISTLVDAAVQAAAWNSLTPAEQLASSRAVGHAETVLRMLPVRGSDVAATWASRQLGELRRASVGFGYELEPAVDGFRARLLEWQKSPGRARRGFLSDLATWGVADQSPAAKVVADQDAWVAAQYQQKHEGISVFEAEPVAPVVPLATPAVAVPLAAPVSAPDQGQNAPAPTTAIPVIPPPVPAPAATPAGSSADDDAVSDALSDAEAAEQTLAQLVSPPLSASTATGASEPAAPEQPQAPSASGTSIWGGAQA